MTIDAFRTARVARVRPRPADTDAMPGAPAVDVLGYDLWQRVVFG